MSTADSTAAAVRNAITRQSGSSGTRMFSTGATLAGNVARMTAGNTRAMTTMRASPAAAAGTASTRLSTINWRATRHLLAPSARRTAISGCRASARASIRFVTFAEATRSTRPNADMMNTNKVSIRPSSMMRVASESMRTATGAASDGGGKR